MSNLIKIIDLISLIRKISQKNLPVTTSFIPYDILVYLYKAYTQQQLINLKEFFLQFKHSEMGVRYHLNQLMDDGWISLAENPADKRSKVLVMNPIFIANMETMLSEIAAYIQLEATLSANAPLPNGNGHSLNDIVGPPPSSAPGTGNGHAPPDQPHADPPPAPS